MSSDNVPAVASVDLVPADQIRKATDIASVCKAIVEKTAKSIQNRKFVQVEGWMSIATAHGCIASARDVEWVEGGPGGKGGFKAIGEIRHINTGNVIAQAEGFVGEDEPVWFGGPGQKWENGRKVDFTYPKRPDYAIRAMAQTRAISRACRSAFAHVVVMMDAGLSTTPAEEVPDGGFNDPAQGAQSTGGAEQSATHPNRPVEVPRDAGGRYTLPDGVKWQDVTVHFGKHKGTPLGKLEDRTISWYLEKWEAKPYGNATDISAEDKLLIAAVNAWADEQDAKQGRSA